MSNGARPTTGPAPASFGRLRGALAASLTVIALLIVSSSASASSSFYFGEEAETPQAGLLSEPHGLGVSQTTGDVYVANGFTHRVSTFDESGHSLFAFGWGAADGSEEEQLCTSICHLSPFTANAVKGALLANAGPVAVDPSSGDVYVVDQSKDYRRVEKFNSAGDFLLSFGGDVVAFGPDNSTNNEVQTVTVTATGGTFRLAFDWPFSGAYNGNRVFAETGPLAFNASATEVETALNGLSTVNGGYVSGGHVSVTGGPGDEAGSTPYELTFEGNLGGDDVPALKPSDSLTGAGHAVAVETLHSGGEAEVCNLAAGDACKQGGDVGSGAPGTFGERPEHGGYISVGASGDVYVGDESRVERFTSAGAFSGEIPIPGGEKTLAVAADSSGDVYVISEGISGVQEFDSTGTLLRTLHPEGRPELLTMAPEDNVYVGTEINGGESAVRYEFAGYAPDGTQIAQLGSGSILRNGTAVVVEGMATSSSRLYALNERFVPGVKRRVVVMDLPHHGPPTVEEETASDVEPTTATLHATVNPYEYDTHYHFEYLDAAQFSNGGFSNPATTQTASVDMGLVAQDKPIQVAISPLVPATVYHFRAVAESECEPIANPGHICVTSGPDETFEALPPVSVRDLTTQTVGPELVTLKGDLNPNGQASNYTIEYGTDLSYSAGSLQGSLPIGNEFVHEEVTLPGLKPNTTYHYRLIAENGYGPTDTGDRTFTTELSSAEERDREDCPNGWKGGEPVSNLREENASLALPDCRAYEQVSATKKEGGEAFPNGYLAPDGNRLIYDAGGAFSGAEVDEVAVWYLAQRSETGWHTLSAIGVPAGPGYQSGDGGTLDFSKNYDRWIFGEQGGFDSENKDPSAKYYSMGFANGTFVDHATPTFSNFEGGAVVVPTDGVSEDLSRLFIVTRSRLLGSDPRPTGIYGGPLVDRIYEVSGAGTPTAALRLATEVPLGLSGPSCQLAKSVGAEGGETRSRRLISGDGSTLIYSAPIEEEGGAECGPGKPNPIGLFALHTEGSPSQLNVAPTTQCSSPAPCASAEPAAFRYDGASNDARWVWFTTPQPLIDSDTDGTNDLYVGQLEDGQLIHLAQASAGDVTATHPSPGSGAKVGEDGVDQGAPLAKQGVVRISTDGSHAAFESPAVLTEEENALHLSAVRGANNLYVYDAETEKVKFVAELCSGPGLSGSERFGAGETVDHEISGDNAVPDSACPQTVDPFISPNSGAASGESDDELWDSRFGASSAKFTPDGRYLIFTSIAQLTPGDTDGTTDLFRYDFQTGDLIRLSFGRNGNDGNGNDDAYPVRLEVEAGTQSYVQEEGADRSISEDGSVVIFRTVAPLVSRDTNLGGNPTCDRQAEGTGCDVYEWEEQGHGTCSEPRGCISLISDGLDPHGAHAVVLSASGNDITFQTLRSEIPSDKDGVGDIYDARVDGGFHTPHPASPCGSPEACQPPLAAAPTPPPIASETFVGPGNAKTQLECGRGRHRAKRHGQIRCIRNRHAHRHRKKRHHARAHRRAGSYRGGGR